MLTTKHVTQGLESGDRLSRAEFHRRYCAEPEIKKAELINGVVYVASPARNKRHGRPQGVVIGWLFAYNTNHAGVELADNATVHLGPDDEVQPDALLYRPGHPDCHLRETDDDYLEGAPDLVVEVAASSASYDLHDKKESYRRAGVPEYLVWRTEDRAFDWVRLVEGQYAPVQPDAEGMIESVMFPGLRLLVPALLAGDYAALLTALDTAP